MTLYIVLLILFLVLIIFILFREELLSLFKSKLKLERRNRDNRETQKTPKKQKPQTKKRTQKSTPEQKSYETKEREREEREKKKREANARAFREQRVAKEAVAKKEAEKKAAAKKAAKVLEEARKAELAKEAKAKAYETEQRELAKKEAEEKDAAEKARKEIEEAKKTEAKTKELPKREYPDFDNSRLLGMGLTQEDADTFVLELIEQIDDHIPQLEEAIESGQYDQIERLTHSLKGSATNLGTGGVANVLIDFNTYSKEGKEKEIILAHLNNLKAYQEKLKSQFS